jgi:hypothetical protein
VAPLHSFPLSIPTVTDNSIPRPSPAPLAAKTSAEELRTASRFRQEPKTAFVTIRHSVGENLRVEIYDESLFGICLVMPDTRGLTVGDEIELTYASIAMHATVKHVTPHKEEFYLVGLATRPVIDESSVLERDR